MKCCLTNKRKSEDGSFVATLTCFRCGHSSQITFGGWSAVSCIVCSMLLERGEYLSNKKLKDLIESTDKLLENLQICVSNNAAAGVIIAGPYISYRTVAKKREILLSLKKISEK